MKIVNKRRRLIRISIIVLSILLVGVTYVFAFPYKKSARIDYDNLPFEAEYKTAEEYGFVDSNELSDVNKLVAQNENFELYLDETTSHFYVKEIKSGEVIESNPRIDDPRRPGGNVALRQKATIEYYTVNERGVESSRYDNYLKSIYHQDTANPADVGIRTFKIKELDDGFQVFYQIIDLDADYLHFPLYLQPEVFEPILARDRSDDTRDKLLQVYDSVPDSATGLYKAKNYTPSMRLQHRIWMYDIFYNGVDNGVAGVFPVGEYTRDKAIAENAENGFFEEQALFSFEVAIQITIDLEGFEIKVLENSIKEDRSSGSRLSRISLYPHLGTAIDADPVTKEDSEGYIVIPDGSGAVMEFKNEVVDTTIFAPTYTKRLYGSDLAKLPYEMPEAEEEISLPLYGMVKENIGFAAIITKGSGQASISAGLSGVNNDSYNKVFPTFSYLESESVVLGGGWNTYRVNIGTRNRAEIDFTVKYVILTGDENNYVGIAKAYQNYLVKEKGMEIKDSTTNTKVVLDLLGAFETQKYFLGIPYNAKDTLTTFKQAEQIVNEIMALGVNDIDIIYSGINKEGLNNNLENTVNISSKLGGKRGFNDLEKKLSELGIDIYPTTNLITTYEYNRIFDQYKYSSRRVTGDLAVDFLYHVPTKLPNSETGLGDPTGPYIINPIYYETLLNAKNSKFKYSNLYLQGIGSRLSSSYEKNNELFKDEALEIHERLLSNIDNQKIALNKPSGSLFPYANLITDLPVETTLYTIFDYSIPLIQLALSGFVDYTSDSINMASERDVQYKFLKAIETGSNLKYTLSFDNSLKLLNTEYNEYMSTEYTNWLEDIENHTKILNDLNIHNATLVGHERLLNNVYKSTYSNGVVIIINYGITPATVEGATIPSLDYVAKEGS